jgi:hypothetical protein
MFVFAKEIVSKPERSVKGGVAGHIHSILSLVGEGIPGSGIVKAGFRPGKDSRKEASYEDSNYFRLALR